MLWPFFRGPDARRGQARRRPGLRPRHRPLRSDAIGGDDRRPDRLPVVLLPLPHPDEPGDRATRATPSSGRGPFRRSPAACSADEVRRLLAVVPDTVAGRRDRAILLTFILTGRRRAEVIGLRAGDISLEDDIAFYSYRGKGGKTGRRELPGPAYEALAGEPGRRRAQPGARWTRRVALGGRPRCGRASRARRSTAASGATCSWPGCPARACTSSATPRRSCGGMPASRSRPSARSSTTARWP